MKHEYCKLTAAVHLFIVKNKEILLLKRQNTGFADGLYSVVAGHLEKGEQAVEAAVREAKEEAGITIDPQDVRMVGVMHRKSDSDRLDFFVEVTRWSGEIVNAEPDKCAELIWYSLHDLPDGMMIPYVRKAIANYMGSRWFESYGWSQSLT
ncbi:MAG TPA: NUDIX domain-containing protein [Bacilli bacterium]